MFLITWLTACMALVAQPLSFDFGTRQTGTDWQVVNDGVMGGLSEGKAELDENSLVFTGTVSLRNNGGFTSLKSPFQNWDLSQMKTVEIRYRSTGFTMALTLENTPAWYLPNAKLTLPETSGEWHTLNVPIEGFRMYQMGQPIGQSPSASFFSDVQRIGFMNQDKKVGNLRLEVDYIRFE